MAQNIIYIGLDVDNQNYHGTAFSKDSGQFLQFKCRPTLKGLCRQLDNLKKTFKGFSFKLCYEASYIGFTLQRDLTKAGYACEVIAPSSIPRTKGNQIKTDRVDSYKLAQFYANNVLSVVRPPDPEIEVDRDFMRS